jgi:DNA-binding MarR family transcriptional regulator
MDKNIEFTKKIFDIIHRLKRAGINQVDEVDNDIRPSEEMFLINIGMISKNSKVKVNDLVGNLKFAPSTISTILKSLEDNGYIIREINEYNRREVFVKMTDKGRLRLESAKERHFKLVSDLIDYLGEDDARKLIEILEKTTCFFEKRKEMRGKTNNDEVN